MNHRDTVEADLDTLLARWHLHSPRELGGGYQNRHWLVHTAGNSTLVLRRYKQDHFQDLSYEFEVMERLDALGVPVPVLVEEPMEFGGTTWCLITHLPGAARVAAPAEEQRQRGRLLAEFHEQSGQLDMSRQRSGWQDSGRLVDDPALVSAVRRYEAVRPREGYVLRWHLDQAREKMRLADMTSAQSLVLHGDFVGRNLLFEGQALSGILDFEATHLNFRVADFAMSWRGIYDEVVLGYDEVRALTDIDWYLLVPTYWSWLFIGLADWIGAREDAALSKESLDWQMKQFQRRSPLFGDLRDKRPAIS